MNDSERKNWVNNDEGLYLWWKSSRKSLAAFVRENRGEIDAAVSHALGHSGVAVPVPEYRGWDGVWARDRARPLY